MLNLTVQSVFRSIACAVLLGAASAASAGEYERDYPSPPVNPDVATAELNQAEGVYRNAEGRLDRAVRSVRDAEKRARDAAHRLRFAHKSIDEYLANRAPSDAGRQAVVAIEEARRNVQSIRSKAIAPLKRDPIYRRMTRSLEDARERFEELETKRLRADFLGRRMDKQDREDIVYLADKIFELETDVFARELDVLDEHGAYQRAIERLSETKKVARSTMDWLRELERDDPQRKALADAIRKASEAAREADAALARARAERTNSKKFLASASRQVAEARRVKSYADRGLAPPRRGD